MSFVLQRPERSRAKIPGARGPWTRALFEALQEPPGARIALAPASGVDVLADDDFQLALYACYELHYGGLAGVDDRWEWEPSLLSFRAELERHFERALSTAVPATDPVEALDVGDTLQRLVAADEGPPLSRFAETQANREQMLEHVIHRSAYQLKEADPHSWAIPRLRGAPKAALLEIQFDEYGAGRAERMHSVLFEGTMRALGLDATYGTYVDQLPGITLAGVNLMTYFGLHRRRRGALVGHLAAFEMTSSIPNRRYGNALRRLGYGPDATLFYDEHVEADAVHENIAAWDLAGGLAAEDPEAAEDIVFGARSLLVLEARWAAHLLDAWRAGRSSLLPLSHV